MEKLAVGEPKSYGKRKAWGKGSVFLSPHNVGKRKRLSFGVINGRFLFPKRKTLPLP